MYMCISVCAQGSSDAIISIGIASTGKYIMTCTETSFTVWTVKGQNSVHTKFCHQSLCLSILCVIASIICR